MLGGSHTLALSSLNLGIQPVSGAWMLCFLPCSAFFAATIYSGRGVLNHIGQKSLPLGFGTKHRHRGTFCVTVKHASRLLQLRVRQRSTGVPDLTMLRSESRRRQP